jgi:hypothetical protein
MHAEPVKLVGEARFGGESPGAVIAHDGGLTVAEALCVAQVIQHQETGRERMKAAEGGVRPQRDWQLLDRFESPADRLNLEGIFHRG